MNRTLTSLILLLSLMLFVVSPFSALAMLMMVIFAGAVIGLVSMIVQVIIKPEPSSHRSDQSPEP